MVGSKYNVPNAPDPPIERLEEAEPVKLFAEVMEATVPLSESVVAPRTNLPDVRVRIPTTEVVAESVTPAVLFIVKLFAPVNPLPVNCAPVVPLYV